MPIFIKPICEGAIEEAIKHPWFYESLLMLGLKLPIIHHSDISVNYTNYVVNGTNYHIHVNDANQILYSRLNNRIIGIIMIPGNKIPDLSTRIVWQNYRGIYGTMSWDTIRTYLLVVTNRNMTCEEFAENVTYVLNRHIGYVSTTSEMNPMTQSKSEIMGALTRLFYIQTPNHATEHMKKILKLMDQLNTGVL
jgi:hypothetical protein